MMLPKHIIGMVCFIFVGMYLGTLADAYRERNFATHRLALSLRRILFLI